MTGKMNNKEFIKKLYDVLQNHKTCYMWGSFGQPITDNFISSKCKQFKDWYKGKIAKFKSLVGKNYYAFDCVGLIKAILWGWNNGGADYGSNKVPDTSANGMLDLLKDVSSNFEKIEKGEAVWMPGHIGVYVGDGKVIECSPRWGDGVQLTACLNIKPIRGLNGRKWVNHGKLIWVDYGVIDHEDKKDRPSKTYTVLSNCRCYDSPNTKSRMIKTYHANDKIRVYAIEKGWAKLDYDWYIESKYLKA